VNFRDSGSGMILWLKVPALLGVLFCPAVVLSRVIEIHPSNADAHCNEEFENIANTLLPGDTLLLRGGKYS